MHSGLSESRFPTSPAAVVVRPQTRARFRTFPALSILRFLLLAVVFCLLPGSVVPGSQTAAANEDQGIRVEIAADGQLRIENRFGGVSIEVARQREVTVAVKLSGGQTPRKSPVVIDRKNDLLVISVVRAVGDSQTVTLNVRVPETVRAEVFTTDGEVNSYGLPKSLSVNTRSGSIHASVPQPFDVDVMARSLQGLIRSEIGAGSDPDNHSFRSRLGSGRQILRITSQRGQVRLSSLPLESQLSEAATPPKLQSQERSERPTVAPVASSLPEEVDEGDVIRVDTELVNMNFSVVDRSTNRGVSGLSARNFKLFEDGVSQQILHFDSSAAPFDLILLIDLSGSTREMVKLIRIAARRFVEAARPIDRIAIITFAAKPLVISPLTLDRAELRRSVETIDTLRGDTKLYDATDFTLNEVISTGRSSRRSALVMMSDGLDGSIPGVNSSNVPEAGSRLEYRDLFNKLTEFDGVVYSLWLNTYYEALNPQDTQPEAFDMGHDRMKELAEAGGGVFYEVDQLEDLAGAYERVVADLGTLYSLSYRPVNKVRDGKWRKIRVTVDRDQAIARGKHGYYAN